MPAVIGSEDEAALRLAVAEAERRSGAEVVPVLARASDAYRLADWRAAAGGALAGALAGVPLEAAAGWSALARWAPALAAAAGALLGLAAVTVPALRRLLAGARELDARVDAAAAAEFLRREVFRTRDRTGLLIYVSLFERRVRVLADEGVYRAVERPRWEELAGAVAADMRAEAPARALLEAVRRAGELVAAHGPRRRADDRNELPDAPLAT
jgi:putative membrane protein